MIQRAWALLLLGAVALVLSACGSESEEDEVARALAVDLRGADAFADDIGAEEARCVGDELVAALGADGAAELGPGPDGEDAALALDELTDDEIGAIGAAMERCVEGLESIVVDIVAQGVLTEPDDSFPVSPDGAQCIGSTVASDIPFDRLLAFGLQVGDDEGLDDLPAGEARLLAGAFAECVDVRSILLDQLRADGADEEVVACLDEQITDGDIEALFIESFSGGDADADAAFAPAIDACT